MTDCGGRLGTKTKKRVTYMAETYYHSDFPTSRIIVLNDSLFIWYFQDCNSVTEAVIAVNPDNSVWNVCARQANKTL